MKKIIYLSIALIFSTIVSKAQILYPIQISMYDSTYNGSQAICAQPWTYSAQLSANGDDTGNPTDSVQFFVNWGDGTSGTFSSNIFHQTNNYWAYGSVNHTYTSAGIYSILIIGTAYSAGNPWIADTIFLPGHLIVSNCDQVYGNVFLDENNDCAMNGSDIGAQNIYVEFVESVTGNVVHYAYTDAYGNYSAALPTGLTYTANINGPLSASAYNCTSGPAHTFTLSGSHSHDFALMYNPSNFDLAVGSTSQVIALNGAKYLSFNITELMNISAQSANVTVTIPSGLTPTTSNQNYTFSGNTITFDPTLINLFGFNAGNWFYVNFSVDQNLIQMGDTVCFTINVAPTSGDINLSNNSMSSCSSVLNSYDPNDKQVYPAGVGAEGFISATQTLRYNVNFQNTGNSMAYNIDVVDNIDSDFDMSTFQLISTSHPCQVLVNGNEVVFHFANINLPDSGSNEPESHGNIQYSIKPQSSAPGTEFTNTAYIYFDMNPAIVTNTTLNTIQLLSVEGVNGEKFDLTIYPNPATNVVNIKSGQALNGFIRITDVNGRKILQQNVNSNNTQINLSGLDTGMYLLEINSNNLINTQKLLIRK